MTIHELAHHYLRYWYRSGDEFCIADNAPPAFWIFVTSLGKAVDRGMLYAALKAVAENKPVQVPSTQEMVAWFGRHPHAYTHFNSLLGVSRPPKSFDDLVEKAYKREMFSLSDHLYKFLNERITKS